MCYSQEVQLITAAIIIFFTIAYWFIFHRRYTKEWQIKFLKFCCLTSLAIGMHQFFEFLTLLTGNSIIYKIGLIFSISAIYFAIRSLEVVGNTSFRSKWALYLIGLVSLHIIFSDMVFSEGAFFVRHESTFFWLSAWMLMFVYWHVCAYKIWKKDIGIERKFITEYIFFTVDLSFLAGVIYVLYGDLYLGYNVCTDFPSIWCTFAAAQAILIPLMLMLVPKLIRPKNWKLSNKEIILMIFFSLLVLALMISLLPMYDCLTWKFIFP